MRASASFIMCATVAFTLFSLTSLAIVPSANAAPDCPDDVEGALAQARKALASGNTEDDSDALACLVNAVAALDGKLNALIAGEIEFRAPISAPGFLHAIVEEGAK